MYEMHLHFERSINTKCDCSILSLTWMGKVPDVLPEDVGWKLNRTNYYQEGWLATGNIRGIVGVTFTTSHCKKNIDYPVRTNYNLRGHRSEVILVKWNEPYQKLASCDSSGIIFVWIKYEGRWSIELINDRNTPVTYFSWSHDGRMALICYQDGFVLVGSVAGQRYWSSMLNLDSTITCGIWTPDDQQVYFGTTSGHIVVMDVHGTMISQVQLGSDVGISTMVWSCEKFKMEEDEVSLFSGLPANADRDFVLAVCLTNGYLYLLKTFDDVSPIIINTGLEGAFCMEWSNSREILALAGTVFPEGIGKNQLPGTTSNVEYKNFLKFYTETGILLFSINIPSSQAPVTALTWGHNDKRLFIATANEVHIAWVSKRIASLQLMCRLKIQSCVKTEMHLSQLPLPLKLRNLIGNLFAQTIRCCVPNMQYLREFVSRPPSSSIRLHCTMIRHDDDSNLSSSGQLYTLYLEYLGGLVPLLKGKRTSKIRPEFVIFDPQAENSIGNSNEVKKAQTNIWDLSDSEKEEESCSLSRSPLMQRKRKKRKPKHTHAHPFLSDHPEVIVENFDDLSYIDTLPESERLVEVTSNIWGTKFKIHGLAPSIPENLGQITYKTSLLHLQPRQMTLVITELRDDLPPGPPDPNFNPNLFSEDEDENIPTTTNGNLPYKLCRHFHHHCPKNLDAAPIAPMSPKNITSSRLQNSRTNLSSCSKTQSRYDFKNDQPEASSSNAQITSQIAQNSTGIIRTESYEEEFPYVDLIEMLSYCEPVRVNQMKSSIDSITSLTSATKTTNKTSQSINNNQPQVNNKSPQATNNKLPQNSINKQLPTTSNKLPTQTNSIKLPQQQSNGKNSRNKLNKSLTLNTTPKLPNSNQYNKIVGTPSGNTVSPSGGRHAVSPIYCDSSVVPALQSPKNAVAPSDIIFDRPSIQSYSNDYSNGSGNGGVQIKSAPVNYPLENKIKKIPPENYPRKMILSSQNSYENQPASQKEISQNNEISQQLNKYNLYLDKKSISKTESLESKWSKKSDELQYIDEDSIAESTNELTALPRKINLDKIPDVMVRSCSVGYLDLVDPHLIPSDLTLNNLLKKSTPPKRLILVKTRRKAQRRHISASTLKNSQKIHATPKLKNCGKSKSLDSWPADKKEDTQQIQSKLEINNNNDNFNNANFKNSSTTINSNNSKTSTNVDKAETPEYEEVQSCSTIIPETPKLSFFTSSSKSDNDKKKSTSPRNNASLHAQAMNTLESLLNRIRDSDFGGQSEVSTAPSTPLFSSRLPHSSPSSPSPVKKGKRNQSASPIRRHLLNSPLLGRRLRNKSKNLESSDDEVNTAGSGDENFFGCGKNYKDLETFQKAQLRQKLKRGKIEPNGVSCTKPSIAPIRREFVMHNKAPMWNENSQVYQLDFGGRVTQESAKNFQIEFRGKQVMQFGRIDGNAYTLDFQYPFSALQAFAVALANVTQRLK